MPIELIDKIKPKNGQGFPLVDAEDVVMSDGSRLSNFSPKTQTDYSQNDSTAKDYIKNRPFYEGEPTINEFIPTAEATFTYTESDGAFVASGTPSPEMLALWKSDWKNCVFTWDGVEYVCEPQMVQGVKCIGNAGAMMGTGDSGEPFIVMCADASLFGIDIWMIYDLATEITGTIEEGATTAHEVGLVINAPNIAKLDPKYLENIDYETQVINKPFGTTPSGTVLFDKTVVCDEEGQAEIDYIKLVEGITYTAEIDGTVYTAVASANGGLFFLNLDDDHALITFGGATILSCPVGEHTVKVALAEDVVKKIDEKYLPDGIGGGSLPEVATSIDLSKFDSNGIIEETYASGTKTTTVEFDASGNPTKITDGDGNVITLTW